VYEGVDLMQLAPRWGPVEDFCEHNNEP